MTKNLPETLAYLDKFTSRKVKETLEWEIARIPDSLLAWITRYLHVAVVGVRSEEVTSKIALHLHRFQMFFLEAYGHDRISTCVRRDVAAWQKHLQAEGMAPSTVNRVSLQYDKCSSRLRREHMLHCERENRSTTKASCQ